MLRELQTIDRSALAAVNGGRYKKGPPQVDPKMYELMAALIKEVQTIGQQKAQSDQQFKGICVQMMQEKFQGKPPPRR